MEITALVVDIRSNPQQGSEPVKAAILSNQEDLVEKINLDNYVYIPAEAEHPFKRFRRVAKIPSEHLTSPHSRTKGIVIHDPSALLLKRLLLLGKTNYL